MASTRGKFSSKADQIDLKREAEKYLRDHPELRKSDAYITLSLLVEDFQKNPNVASAVALRDFLHHKLQVGKKQDKVSDAAELAIPGVEVANAATGGSVANNINAAANALTGGSAEAGAQMTSSMGAMPVAAPDPLMLFIETFIIEGTTDPATPSNSPKPEPGKGGKKNRDEDEDDERGKKARFL